MVLSRDRSKHCQDLGVWGCKRRRRRRRRRKRRHQ